MGGLLKILNIYVSPNFPLLDMNFHSLEGGATVLLFAKKTNAKGAKNSLTGDKYYQLATEFGPTVEAFLLLFLTLYKGKLEQNSC